MPSPFSPLSHKNHSLNSGGNVVFIFSLDRLIFLWEAPRYEIGGRNRYISHSMDSAALSAIGASACTYTTVQAEDSFCLIDQHAAHEPIYYEDFAGGSRRSPMGSLNVDRFQFRSFSYHVKLPRPRPQTLLYGNKQGIPSSNAKRTNREFRWTQALKPKDFPYKRSPSKKGNCFENS
jgi:hypothetical protein